jgi:hypothetical protein
MYYVTLLVKAINNKMCIVPTLIEKASFILPLYADNFLFYKKQIEKRYNDIFSNSSGQRNGTDAYEGHQSPHSWHLLYLIYHQKAGNK